jgi:hypothetical protein
MLKLSYRYSLEAGREIANLERMLTYLYNKGGAEAVRDHLSEQADTYATARVNSWQAAMYKALAGSDWFCDGGFLLP